MRPHVDSQSPGCLDIQDSQVIQEKCSEHRSWRGSLDVDCHMTTIEIHTVCSTPYNGQTGLEPWSLVSNKQKVGYKWWRMPLILALGRHRTAWSTELEKPCLEKQK